MEKMQFTFNVHRSLHTHIPLKNVIFNNNECYNCVYKKKLNVYTRVSAVISFAPRYTIGYGNCPKLMKIPIVFIN